MARKLSQVYDVDNRYREAKGVADNVAGKQFLQSPAGKTILSKLAAASGVEDIKSFIEDAKAVKTLVDEYTPEIKTFTTKGRLYNKATNEPAVGVVVKPQLALLPMVLETKTRKIKIDDPSGEKNKLTGKVKKIKIEETYKEYVWDDKATPPEIKTDEKGEYEIRFGVPTLPKLGDTILVKPIVLYENEHNFNLIFQFSFKFPLSIFLGLLV